MGLTDLFKDMVTMDGDVSKKIKALDGFNYEISDEIYDYPSDKTSLAAVWFLFGERKEYVLLTYYSVLSFLRNTDLKNFNRYIVIPRDYEYEYLLPLFKQLGVGIKYTSKPFKYIDSQSDIVKRHTHVFSIDSDCFAYSVNKPKTYFNELSLYLQNLAKIGMLNPYLCMNLNKGGGLIMNRLHGYYIALTNDMDSGLKKYYTDVETEKKYFEPYHVDDIESSLRPIIEGLERDFDIKELVTNFISSQWPVNEVFCLSTEVFKDHLLYEIIEVSQRNQKWFWDDEIVYKIYFALSQQHNHHIIPLTKTPDNPSSYLIRPHGVPPLESMDSEKLYFVHPYNEIGDWWDIKDLHRVLKNEKPSEEGF